ncbi:selenocysteine-specific translation elongation factor [Denitratisoma oestradiolicum]|uniref:Selenocysteine-specific translation elongation factor n=1 Tax=Denitratisoma oestradiolicum TaxID=311182 RepID=A0A6S6Y002_9PROT|nr:selenocysteine-specific translation elongation factor [Denitratisoma oestradiolicum]TWO80104.1 selenocysteine-specific translation elongation factor [Denitratisoma oestradiolicum]CAB1370061.1 Selenocysteine-specific translation elongation factor [Denitratisoma oestradiolicum]
MIVATAGHVDHGKTSLVRQLTGVNTDRLEEEQRRGMTIALGFAYRKTAAGASIGFIDVPGHRRFINTMIAGIRGVDLGMLVVDAGEGVMPQTREHVRVMELLGVRDTLAVVTKTDRVSPEQLRAVSGAVGGLLPGAQVFPVSSLTGEGMVDLQAELAARAERQQDQEARGYFRLSVDRAFVLKGAGLIVTGTAMAGRVAVGDSLLLYTVKSGSEGIKVRVRSIHAQDEAASTGQSGQRCALNLVGDVEREDIQRGDMLADARCVAPGLRFDARLRLLDDLPFSLKHLQPVKLYLGARRLAARVYFLETDGPSSPAGMGLVQFVLQEPLQVCWGDRFLIQDDSESVILGGGRVLGPAAPQWHKRKPARLAWLAALDHDDPAAILGAWLEVGMGPVDLAAVQTALNLRDDELAALLSLPTLAGLLRLRGDHGDWLLNAGDWNAQREQLFAQVADWHKEHPMDAGMPQALLLRGNPGPAFLAAVLEALVQEKRLLLAGGRVSCAGYRATLPTAIQAGWERLQAYTVERGFHLPLLSEIERDLGLGTKVQGAVIATALKSGQLVQVSSKRLTLPSVLQGLAVEIQHLAARQEIFSVIETKVHLGLGRDLTIEILEYFDSVKFTRREGNGRRLRDADWPRRMAA